MGILYVFVGNFIVQNDTIFDLIKAELFNQVLDSYRDYERNNRELSEDRRF